MPTGVIKKEEIVEAPAVEKKVPVQQAIIDVILPTQQDLAKLVQDIKTAIVNFKQIPGHWTDIIIKIMGSDDESQGLLQRLSTAQSLLRSYSEINYDMNLQRIAAYLGDQFNLLLELEQKITTELVVARKHGTIKALLSEIEDACNSILDKIIGIKTYKEKFIPKKAAA